MYSKAIEEEDSKAVETLQKDADGILIFVSSYVSIHISLYIKQGHYRAVYLLLQ